MPETIIPQPLDRMKDLPTKIRAVAAGIQALRGYITTDPKYEITEEETRMVDIKTTLFTIYSRNVEEFEALFVEHSRNLDMWRKDLMNEVTPLTSHMGPLAPPTPIMTAGAKHFDPPDWTKTDEELAAKSQSELERVLAGNL